MVANAPTTKVDARTYIRFLARYLRPRIFLVGLLGIALLISIALQLINPQILRSFIDQAQAGQETPALTRLALLFIFIAVLQQVIGVGVVYVTENLGWATTNDLRLELARYTLGLDMSFHTAHTPGEMIERIDGDIMALSNFFSQFILQVFGNALLLGGILLVLLREDWRVSLALLVFVVLTVVLLLKLANIAVPAWEAERQASANLFGFLEERLSGTEDIRSNNAKNYVLDRFYRLTRDLMRKTIRAGLRLNILLNTTWVLFAVGNAVAILVSAALFRSETITLGTVYMILFYTNMMNWPLERITQQMQDLQRAGASLIRVMGLQQIQGKIPGEDQFQLTAAPVVGDGPLAVAFEDMTFGYQDSASSIPGAPGIPGVPDAIPSPVGERRPIAADITTGDVAAAAFSAAAYGGVSAAGWEAWERAAAPDREIVLHNISFRLAPGRVIGLLGRTGSGKTTLTRLIFRLYDPTNGKIRIGTRDTQMADLRQVPVQELRRRVGMVTQNIQLFHATVRENLTFFDATIPDERILAAIEDLGLTGWFNGLPKGLDTELESGGGGLSAGEAQLLAFTRIFLRDPGLVILDEATSRLDPATEHLIERAVDRLVQNRTAIIVAHRLGTVHRADEILILDNGRISEYGERARLAEDPHSRFYHLLQTGLEEVLV